MNNPNKIDSFYEIFQSSRCKTAMLVITCLVFFGIVLMELFKGASPFMQFLAISVMGFWTGRATKPTPDEPK